MTGHVGKTTNLQREVVGQQAQSEREDGWGPMPGEIVDYDAATQTATVKPLFKKRRYDGTDLDLPNLVKVPVDFPRSGSSGLTFPVPAGTRVQLQPQMRSMERYDTEDDGAYADDFAGSRSFNLSDMRATIAGGDSLTDPMKGVDAENVHLRGDAEGKYGYKVSPSGKIAIEGSQGNFYELNADAIALLADGFTKLGTEATLDHMADYAEIGSQLTDISTKLGGMKL